MLNDTQFDKLAPYEAYFASALRNSYPRSPGPRALREIHAVLRELDPLTPALNTTCGTCILRVLTKAGKYYFEAKDLKAAEALENADPGDPLLKGIRQAEIDKANDAEAVAATKEAAAAPETPRKSTQKPKTGKAPAKSNKAKKSAAKK